MLPFKISHLLLLLALVAHSYNVEASAELQPIVEPLLRFSSNLYNVARHNKTNENLIMSPLSIHTAMNIMLLGAEPSSTTESEILQALSYSVKGKELTKAIDAHKSYAGLMHELRSTGERKYRWEPATVVDIWNTFLSRSSQPVARKYIEQSMEYYNSSVRAYSNTREATMLADEVNRWAKEAGFEGNVVNVDDLERNSALMLLSAVRFEARWVNEFDEERTKFYNNGRKDQLREDVNGLSRWRKHAKYAEFTHDNQFQYRITNCSTEIKDLDFRAVEIDLMGGLSFVILEPLKQENGTEFASFEAKFMEKSNSGDRSKLSQFLEILRDQVKRHKMEVLEIPKFKFESKLDLKPVLESLGVKKVFGGESELTRIFPEQNAILRKAKHDAVIDLNKDGIKAAALTELDMVAGSANPSQPPPTLSVQVENPFMFVLLHSQVPIFIGRLVHL